MCYCELNKYCVIFLILAVLADIVFLMSEIIIIIIINIWNNMGYIWCYPFRINK